MSIEKYFNSILDEISLKLGDEELNLIVKKHTALRELLRKYLKLEDDFLTGSYVRGTILKPEKEDDKFDVDIFIAFSNEEFGEYELEYLRSITIEALKRIKTNHPDLEITRVDEEQRRSIGVEFGSNFQIDIVPSIEIEKGVLYKIYDKRTLQPVKSNPKLHGKQLTEANNESESGGVKRLIPIVKLLKYWKINKCDYLKSFHLELLAVKIFRGSKITSYSEGINNFFQKSEKYFMRACLVDPANKENIIDGYLDKDGNRSKIVMLIEKVKILSQEAIELENKGYIEEAIEKWDEIFKNEIKTENNSSPQITIKNPSGPHLMM